MHVSVDMFEISCGLGWAELLGHTAFCFIRKVTISTFPFLAALCSAVHPPGSFSYRAALPLLLRCFLTRLVATCPQSVEYFIVNVEYGMWMLPEIPLPSSLDYALALPHGSALLPNEAPESRTWRSHLDR